MGLGVGMAEQNGLEEVVGLVRKEGFGDSEMRWDGMILGSG